MGQKITLNLSGLNRGNVEYKISRFPDGQQSLEIIRPLYYEGITVVIESRLNSFQDLELIICANQAVRNMGCRDVELSVPYFLGARSDRRFNAGSANYLKQVICPIINSQNFSKVIVTDPHSDVLEACLNNFVKNSNVKLVRWALTNIDNKDHANIRVALVSPDAGASKKIYDLAKELDVPYVTTASKSRDIRTGQIVKTEVPTLNLDKHTEHIVIIDDICDGGRTFIELAKELRKQTDKKLYLIVTHGIFSAGFDELGMYFDHIYTTNSVRDIKDSLVTQISVL